MTSCLTRLDLAAIHQIKLVWLTTLQVCKQGGQPYRDPYKIIG